MNKQELKNYLEEGKTFKKIAEIIGVSKFTVDYYVGKYELRESVINQKPCKFLFEKIDSPEKAYFIGFITGDGHFDKNNILELSIKHDDREILKYIESFTDCDIVDDLSYNKSQKKFPSSTIRLKIEDVQTFIGGRLKKERSLPIVKQFLYKNLIQGFFDAEGCITWGYRKDRDRLWQKVSFTSSYSLLLSLQKILINFDISTAIKPKSGEDCYVMEFSNELDVFNFLQILPTEDYFLKRKRDNHLIWLRDTILKYTFNEGDIVKFVDKRTLAKYNIKSSINLKGSFTILKINNKECLLDNGMTINVNLLSKEGISNYALRLKLDEFGEGLVRE